ncbi:MAG: metal ABC transporter substrate-binding protein [Synergistaceae bacterium]|nr:metal ABC transporter substrate-binding protein [Synergistaceae bacterium]
MRKITFALTAAIAFLTIACFGVSPSEGARMKIVTTIFPLYDFTRAVVGDRADLSMLVRPGMEIHSFDPSPRDILTVRDADAFIYVGGESDTWVDTLLTENKSAKTVIRLIDFVSAVEEELVEGMQPEEEKNEDEEEGGEYDEHVWTSPRNAMTLVRAIAELLCETDPQNADAYRTNAKRYIDEIAGVDEAFRAVVASAVRRKIVFGDRFPFRYFADEFGLEYRAAFPGCSTESDVSAATMAYLIKTVVAEKIPVIYVVEQSAESMARTIAEQTVAAVMNLHSCERVSQADMDAGATYLSLMRGNVENLKKGLM